MQQKIDAIGTALEAATQQVQAADAAQAAARYAAFKTWSAEHDLTWQRIGIDIEPLTEREMEILHLIDLGLTNKAIAERLVISVATVKKHISNIFLKLDANNRTQALSRAREYNLIQ